MSDIERRLRAYKPYKLPKGDWFGPKVCAEAADHIAALEARNDRLEEQAGRALEELKLWRMLVNEGGVPGYTVTPGAALNTVVTSTDGLIRSLTTEQTNG